MADKSYNDPQSFELPKIEFEEEGLFARDIDGQLIRVERAVAADFDEDVTLTIDGQEVTVKKAVPLCDSQGDPILDADGKTKPRYTTIFDAASQLFVKNPGDQNPVPTLCHREHLPPVGVCRVCSVCLVEGPRTALVPACVYAVKEGMEVHTIDSSANPEAAERVRTATTLLVELLAADHLPMQQERFLRPAETGSGNELSALAERLGIERSRFAAPSIDRGTDSSSHMIEVDHNQCIMCGRCVRGCNWVKENKIIGRSNKGYATVISFDLGQPMGASDCVSCGECAISCPTGALEFSADYLAAHMQRVRGETTGDVVLLEELTKIPLFAGVPQKFLQFNGGAVVRRDLRKGDVLCREGEYGSTAFILLAGEFEAFINAQRGAVRSEPAQGIRGFFGALRTTAKKVGGIAKLGDLAAQSIAEGQRIKLTPADIILGEMSCMNNYPRSATVTATADSIVLEIRRNVLHMLLRVEASRRILEDAYRQRSLKGQLAKVPLFGALDEASRELAVKFLQDRVDMFFVEPGQTILKQGQPASDFYITKLGFVKVTQTHGREERVVNYLGPGKYFGEIGLLSQAYSLLDEDSDIPTATSTATCAALDHVELIRVRGADFLELLQRFPQLVPQLEKSAREVLNRDRNSRRLLDASKNLDEFLDQGLFLAQSLLVLDLERCTRCDECTKACADTHDGVTRLIREGMRFDRFLVASSCRSCMDPYCLVGCPVDAIHRDGSSLEIEIEDYCIGCGLCANNCPYGNINMHGFPKTETDARGKEQPVFQIVDGNKLAVVQQRATTCDLCQSLDGKPSCVYACPHNAAFRMTGEELMNLVGEG